MKIQEDEIAIIWSADDVLLQAENSYPEMTQKQAMEILKQIEDKHDPCIGINWDVIDCHIDMYMNSYFNMSRKPTTGRFDTREELIDRICCYWYRTNMSQERIGRSCVVSFATVANILKKHYRDWESIYGAAR